MRAGQGRIACCDRGWRWLLSRPRGELLVLEGDWQAPRLVMLEFDDLDAAKRRYESEVYQGGQEVA